MLIDYDSCNDPVTPSIVAGPNNFCYKDPSSWLDLRLGFL